MSPITHQIRFPSLVAMLIFSALATDFATISAAADTSNVPQVVVKFGDLDLSSPQGADKLYRRLAAAADEVCKGFDIDSRDLASQARLGACIHQAITDAVAKVNQPQLFAIYNGKNRTPLPTSLVSQNR
jgi:UrcA family protein